MVANLHSGSESDSIIDYESLIPGDRVHASLYYDPRIFEEELKKIWYRTWVYVGHAGEVPNPGDFRTGHIGKQPIIIVRDTKGEVQVFLNRCMHRGNTVCQSNKGSAQGFLCAYHGWSYNLEGELKGVPFSEGYGAFFKKEELGLVKVPRLGNHRGFLFASLAAEGQSFDDYMSFAKVNIDRFCDISPTGELDVTAGVFKMKVNTNWKMWMENSVDVYHGPSTHASNAYMANYAGEKEAQVRSQPLTGGGPFANVNSRDLGNGHTELDQRPMRRAIGAMTYTGEWAQGVSETAQREFITMMEDFHGKEKADIIAIDGPPHTVMFPNLFFMLQDIRWAVPVSVNETWLYYAPTLLKGAPAEVNAMRLRRDEGAYGPAGFQLSDDLEVWERNYLGLEARHNEWILMNRGWDDELTMDEDGRASQSKLSELTMRTQWQHYKKLMSAD